jgi:hypothetical protein
MTADLVIDRWARRAGESPAAPLLADRPDGPWRRLTNAVAWAQSGAVASWLIAQGFGPEGRIVRLGPLVDPERAVLLLGALRAGALVADDAGEALPPFGVLATCSIDASVAERRLHLAAGTPARRFGGRLQRLGDLATIAEAVTLP